jgi:hypothetical protein
LRGEVLVEGTFVKVVVEVGREGGAVDLGPEGGREGGREKGRVGRVVEGLEVSIQSSRNVLQHLALVYGEGGGEVGMEEGVRRELVGLRREEEKVLRMKEEALEVLLRQHPSFAWGWDRLGGNGRKGR